MTNKHSLLALSGYIEITGKRKSSNEKTGVRVNRGAKEEEKEEEE